MRFVIKVGSAVLSRTDGSLNKEAVNRIATQLGQLHQAGKEIILVSSGAVAAGKGRLGIGGRPVDLREKQAAAAIGQLALMESYEEAFSRFNITPAQILLTREDLSDRGRYLNIRSTLLKLLELKVIPIINENDSVSTEEIQFGDNDALSSIVAAKVGADKLILLSHVQGLCALDSNGQVSSNLIEEVDNITHDLEKVASKFKGSSLTTGGMMTKLQAAKMATAAGIETWIASGMIDDSIQKVLAGLKGAGTRFKPKVSKVGARHAWIAFGKKVKGILIVDDGAQTALVESRKSLLPSGIKGIKGNFLPGDTVVIKTVKGAEIGRGLVNFSSTEVKAVKGRHSRDMEKILGRAAAAEIVHRDNLVLL